VFPPGLHYDPTRHHAGISPVTPQRTHVGPRSAGLTTTAWHRNMVLHAPAAAGISLLNASCAGSA
jgi:hypothetical protein